MAEDEDVKLHVPKVGPDDLSEIFRLREAGTTLQKIASRYGVSKQYISYICQKYGVIPRQNIKHKMLFDGIAQAAWWADHSSKPNAPNFPHGTTRGSQRGCKCVLCLEANRLRTITSSSYQRTAKQTRFICAKCG